MHFLYRLKPSDAKNLQLAGHLNCPRLCGGKPSFLVSLHLGNAFDDQADYSSDENRILGCSLSNLGIRSRNSQRCVDLQDVTPFTRDP